MENAFVAPKFLYPRWVARPSRADITHKRAPGQEPLLVLPHVFMREVGRMWEPPGNCAAKGDFWPWECLASSGGR